MEPLIREEEIGEGINKLKIWKTSGIDGLGPMYYRTFKKILVPKLTFIFNKIMDGERVQFHGGN